MATILKSKWRLDEIILEEYIMRNTGLDEAQAGIKIAGRNINNLRYADDPPLWKKVKRNIKAS